MTQLLKSEPLAKQLKIMILMVVVIVGTVYGLDEYLGFSNERQWVNLQPLETYVGFPLLDERVQLQFIRMSPNTVFDGEAIDLIIGLGKNGGTEPFEVLVKVKSNPHHNPEYVKFEFFGTFADEASINYFMNKRFEQITVPIHLDCNGCRNSAGIIVELYDTNGNLLQSQDLRVRVYEPQIVSLIDRIPFV